LPSSVPRSGSPSARIPTFSGGARMRPPEWRARHQQDGSPLAMPRTVKLLDYYNDLAGDVDEMLERRVLSAMRWRMYNVELHHLGRREANNKLERMQNKMRRRGGLLQVIATVRYGSAEDRVKCAMHKLIDKVFRTLALYLASCRWWNRIGGSRNCTTSNFPFLADPAHELCSSESICSPCINQPAVPQ